MCLSEFSPKIFEHNEENAMTRYGSDIDNPG